MAEVDPDPELEYEEPTAPYSPSAERMVNMYVDQETHERIMKAPVTTMTKGGRA